MNKNDAKTDDSFAQWLEENPAPDLQALVRKHGGYHKITKQAWAEHDVAMARWQAKYRLRNRQ